MHDTVARFMASVKDPVMRTNIGQPIKDIARRISSQTLVSGGLAIHGSASALAKTANTVYAHVTGVLVKLAAADMPALVGSVTNAKFNVYCFYLDSAGVTTSQMGTEGATLAAMVMPITPESKAMIGFVIINPTGTGPFVGGTTALDDGTVVPGAVYINTLGVVDQTILP